MESVLPALHGFRVLLVDDDERDLGLFRTYLEDLPVHVECARSVADALETARRTNPHLVVLEVGIQGMMGFDLCRQLKDDAATSGITILTVTALDGLADLERAAACGTDDFLNKPVNKIELLTRVRALLQL